MVALAFRVHVLPIQREMSAETSWRIAATIALAGAVAGALFFFGGREAKNGDASSGASALLAEAAPPAASAAGMNKEPGACAVVFDKDEAHISDDAIRLAVLGEATDTTISDCRGRAIPVSEKKPLAVVNATLVKGDEAAIEDAGLSGTVLARVSVGKGPSPCAGDVGVIAIVSLHARRLVAEALAPWQAPCNEGASEPLALEAIGREHVLLEEDGESTEVGSIAFARVWLRRGDALVAAGRVVTELTEPERTMSAELHATRDALVATETWTLGNEDEGAARTIVRDRSYVVRGDALTRTPDTDP